MTIIKVLKAQCQNAECLHYREGNFCSVRAVRIDLQDPTHCLSFIPRDIFKIPEKEN
mgnify:CR=1 FL=1